jgi:hypothetical protein
MINKHSKPVLTAQSVYSPFDLRRQGVNLIFKETILLELPLSATSRWCEVTKWTPSCRFDANGGILGSDGFDCPSHGRFKVSEDVLDTPVFRDASRRQWEAALKRARALPQIPALPCIISYHF